MANSTPYLYNDLTQIAKTLSVYGYNQSNIMGALSTIGDTGSALSMSTEDMDSVAQILGYIGSGDTLDSMKLKQLRLKGINANQMLQDYYGISATELNNRVSGGKISGTDAASIILKEMQSTFGGMMQQQSETFTGLTSTVEGLQQEIDNAKGNGYNTTRESSLQDEIDSLGGNLGAKLKSVNGIIGEAEGTKANIEQQILQDVMALCGIGALILKTNKQRILAYTADLIQKAEAAVQGSGLGAQKKAIVVAQLQAAGITVNRWLSAQIDIIVATLTSKGAWLSTQVQQSVAGLEDKISDGNG